MTIGQMFVSLFLFSIISIIRSFPFAANACHLCFQTEEDLSRLKCLLKIPITEKVKINIFNIMFFDTRFD